MVQYNRDVVYETEEAKVVIVTLGGHQKTRIHNHDGKESKSLVIKGTVRNEVFDSDGNLLSYHDCPQGEMFGVGNDLSHRVSNLFKGKAVILNIYM